LPVWVAAYGPKALKLAGEVGDGFILQLADPDVAAWSIQAVQEAAAEAGRDPDALAICVAAPEYVTDGSDASRAHALDQCRWFGGWWETTWRSSFAGMAATAGRCRGA
jgi:alkanesulfonate monooxygenase SsuD/methylene tetrahydromethanopterin reductase-like flavin-dependent oxidoreductase (luciferase family)